jgi:quercetin dioxygenase-like cupin family protein
MLTAQRLRHVSGEIKPMQRRDFIGSLAAALPVGLLAAEGTIASGKGAGGKAFKVPAGQDAQNSPLSLYEGDSFFTKVSGRDTNGQLYIYESTRLRNGGPAQHVHFEQDEWFYIFEGEFQIKVGETLYLMKAGDSVFAPRGIPHVWAKTNEGLGRMLIVFQPAGRMEEYFTAVSNGTVGKMPPEEQERFREAHGFRRVGAALQYHKQ